jgi:hypothetical protein
MQLDKKVSEFKAHYGSPLVIAIYWSDLCSTTIEGALLKGDTWSSRWLYFGITSTRNYAYKSTGTI